MKTVRTDSSKKYYPHRRGERRTARIQFSLCGLNDNGELFEEVVFTRNISENGGCFSSQQAIQVGSTLRVSDGFGFISLIRVAWRRETPGSVPKTFGFRFENLLDK